MNNFLSYKKLTSMITYENLEELLEFTGIDPSFIWISKESNMTFMDTSSLSINDFVAIADFLEVDCRDLFHKPLINAQEKEELISDIVTHLCSLKDSGVERSNFDNFVSGEQNHVSGKQNHVELPDYCRFDVCCNTCGKIHKGPVLVLDLDWDFSVDLSDDSEEFKDDIEDQIVYLSTPQSIEHYIRQFSKERNRRYIPIDDLRNYVAREIHYSHEDFDKALYDLAKSGVIQLLHGDVRTRIFEDLLKSDNPSLPYVDVELLSQGNLIAA